ncbi:hypothetical protein G7Y89_g10303 [Cudoniella acicularis]|uniref:Mediator of RNA polymerase II transcription subunit 10 n=1 Tax=Cudoniella acicularis TaxID=354080 RepID=A0A8H4RD11_9HELO|nr:hypothetical protein G7Y89_g10303 [Cudoniella acicularis]
MAPVGQSDHDVVERQIKNAIQDLYHIMVQVHAYDVAGKPSGNVLTGTVNQLSKDLQQIHITATSTTPPSVSLPNVPPELISYVDSGRNPDIYTREFVELARRGNQLMKGKMEAFGSFRDILAEEMARCLPEVEGDVRKVVRETGGDVKVVSGSGEGK